MSHKTQMTLLKEKHEQGRGYYCDCTESSEALGYTGVKGWKEDEDCDFHVMTHTKIFRDEQCSYCGHYAFWRDK